MSLEYPRAGGIQKVGGKGLCLVCGGIKADARIAIQYSIFRGDDDVLKVHRDCLLHFYGFIGKKLAKEIGRLKKKQRSIT